MHRDKKVILLIEDSKIVSELTKEALESSGHEVRLASGNVDLDEKVRSVVGFLTGIDLVVLDMVLVEHHMREREDKRGSSFGMSMTGGQIGATLAMSHPQLQSAPFLVYSAKELPEIQTYLDELSEFAEYDKRIRKNYKGFVRKETGAERQLVEKVAQILSG